MHHKLCAALVALGLLQALGYLTQQRWLKGIGQVSVAAPLPIVFTQQKGMETFAANFYLDYETQEGEKKRVLITPALYSQFSAPYNYRNVLGAAISYGPIMPDEVWQSVLYFSFQEPGKLAKSLGLKPPLKNASIFIQTRTQGRRNTWTLKIDKNKP